MNSSRSSGKLRVAANRIKRALFDEPRPSIGRSTLAIGFAFGLIWLALTFILPEQPWSNGRFLVVALCFGFWGAADMLPRRWRGMAALLRAAVGIFLLGLGVWIVSDLIASF